MYQKTEVGNAYTQLKPGVDGSQYTSTNDYQLLFQGCHGLSWSVQAQTCQFDYDQKPGMHVTLNLQLYKKCQGRGPRTVHSFGAKAGIELRGCEIHDTETPLPALKDALQQGMELKMLSPANAAKIWHEVIRQNPAWDPDNKYQLQATG